MAPRGDGRALWPLLALVLRPAAADGEFCWSGEFTRERCCGADPVLRNCFDAVYTEELCCGTEYSSPGFVPDEPGCACAEAEEAFVAAAVGAVQAAARPAGGRPSPMPPLAQAEPLCSAFAGLGAPCPAAALAGGALCAHARGLVGDYGSAAAFAEDAAAAAARLSRRRPPFCRQELPRLVSRAFPFSEAEAVRNARRFAALASGAADADGADGAAAQHGWRRRWKPQMGVRSELDVLVQKYRASHGMRAWQKQFGCSGGDTGEEGNFYSHAYKRLFDHGLSPADAPPGPSRRAPARILEVGVCDGSGAAVWSEYFGHPDSRVVALDIDFKLFRANRVYLVQRGFDLSRLAAIIEANASDAESEASVTTGWGSDAQVTSRTSLMAALREHGPFDFIRDDASHLAADMVATFKALFTSVLKPGGVYVVEDTWSYPVVKDVSTSLDQSGEFAYFFRLARDATSLGWRFDGDVFTGLGGAAWIQSPAATPLEAWVESVEFARQQVVVRKRHE